MKRLVYISLLLMFCGAARGQQLPVYSQYLYNKFLINPAVAGSDGYTSYNLTARQQWVGYSDAPKTFSFSGQTRLLKRSYILRQQSPGRQVYRPSTDGRVGIGANVFSDRNGLILRTGFQVSYSYHTWVASATQLSFGLAFTGTHYKIDEKSIDLENPDDPWFNNDLRKGVFFPDAKFGIYLLSEDYTIGLSADQLFESAAKIGNPMYKELVIKRHYYLFGSYIFDINYLDDLEPSLLFAVSEQLTPQVDIGLTFIHDQQFWAGLSYRTGKTIIATLGAKYENLFFGYSFDFTMQEIQRVTYGTHEFTMALKFGDNTRRYRWLDRY